MNRLHRILIYLFIAVFSASLLFPVTATAGDSEMMYLVEFKARDAGAPSGPEQAIALLDGLIVPSLSAMGSSDSLAAGGLFVGARSGAMIVHAKSHDEVTTMLRALPAWGVWNWKVRPLESFSHRANLERANVQALREQMD